MSSIQFRSRIKPAINYNLKLNDFGVCCDSNKDKTRKTFLECFNEGGYFIPNGDIETTTCPDIDLEKGCCCSCSYVNPDDRSNVPVYQEGNENPYVDSGVRSNVSKCECNRLGGKWTPYNQDGECSSLSTTNWESLCVSNIDGTNIDVRTPRRCCHFGFDENTGWPTDITCTNVCTAAECGLYSRDIFTSTFGAIGETCEMPSCYNPITLSILSTNTKLYEGFDVGSCYTLVQENGTYEYNCSVTPESLCDGYWTPEKQENKPFCLSSYKPENPIFTNGKYQVQQMSLSDFNSIGLTACDDFQGGKYIGIFKPSPLNSRSSEVYGNITFKTPTLGRFNADQVGGTDRQWALIVNEIPYQVSFLKDNEPDTYYETSLWDGYYNFYGDNSFAGLDTSLANTIKYFPRNGFIDYYLPSIYELYFYSAYLYNAGITNRGRLISSTMFNTRYINNSTDKTKLYNSGFVYGQIINSKYTNNFQTVLIDVRKPETVLFFRRIVLT